MFTYLRDGIMKVCREQLGEHKGSGLFRKEERRLWNWDQMLLVCCSINADLLKWLVAKLPKGRYSMRFQGYLD